MNRTRNLPPCVFPTSARILHAAILQGLLFLLLLMAVAPPVLAEGIDTKALSKTLSGIEKKLPRKHHNIDQLTLLAEEVTNIKGELKTCVIELEPEEKKIRQVLDSLGKPSKKEPAEVRRKRREIQQKLTSIEQQLASCRVLILKSDDLLKNIHAATNKLLAQKLLARGPDIVTLLRDNWNKPSLWFSASRSFLQKHSGLDLLSAWQLSLLLLLLLLSIGTGVLLRRFLCTRIRLKQWSDDFTSLFLRASITTLAHYAPHLLGSTTAAVLFYYLTGDARPMPFINVVAFGLPPYFLFVAIVHLLLAPPHPATPFLDLPEKLTRALATRLQVLALLAFLGYLLFATLLAQSLPEPALLITRAVFTTILIFNLLWAFSLVMRLPRMARMRWLTIGVYIALLVALIIEGMGYRNLSLALLKDVLGSLLAFGSLLLLSRLFHELYDSLETGKDNWSNNFRKALGIKGRENIPGLAWLRVITSLALWTLFAYVLLLVWDVSDTILLEIQTYLTQGFNLGSLHIIPEKIAGAIITIAIIILSGGWMRNRLEANWLKKTRMERGAREALVTITGYIIVAIAFLVGLGVAGFDFGSLALIAGALSVGIGFGLQNVVNNFISGLILLFERPIKTGDWIVVGGTEGYVKRIRIRSTQIQTFDRADVIIPNSELISNQVTNWMLRDPRGRIRVPVGVAYGTDTQTVKTILESVAAEHPEVIDNGTSPKPKVLFRAFGDSSLDFELRCYIRNIDKRIQIISDLNFAIDAAFRKHNIEIPFPQRDLHIRDWPGQPPAPSTD